jgi:hypothetical protein
MSMEIGPVTRATHEVLIQAINEWRRIGCMYEGRERYLEPQCYGLGPLGEPRLRVHQPSTGSAIEPLFRVDKIENLALLDEYFGEPGPNYKMDDSAMAVIFAQLDPAHPPFSPTSRAPRDPGTPPRRRPDVH